MVDEHLQNCEECQKECDEMKRKLHIPAENQAPILRNINKKWRKKKVMISITSIFATAIILFGSFTYVFYYEKVIPYSKDLIIVEMQNDNQLVSHYKGKSYATVHETHPMSLEINGVKKNVSFIFYTETLADSPSRNLINDEKHSNGQGYTWQFADSEKIDAVYYAYYDVKKITDGKVSWDEILKRAVLVWEK